MTQIDDEEENFQTADVADEIGTLFGQLVGAVVDATPHSPVERRAACDELARCHAKVLQMLAAPRQKSNGGLSGVWLRTKFH